MARRTKHDMKCAICGRAFVALRSDARTCGPTCKKALQRGVKRVMGAEWTARDVTGVEVWLPRAGRADPSPAADKGDTPAKARPVIQQVWPHGTLVTYLDKTTWRPGRINWLSRAGEECTRYARHCTRLSDINNTWQVPVETLCGVQCTFLWDVRRC